MIYDTKNEIVNIDYDDIWLFLRSNFGLYHKEIRELTKEWLDNVYNLRGVTTIYCYIRYDHTLGEVYNLRGVTTN